MIENKINHKRYIGQTKSHLIREDGSLRNYGLEHRWSRHKANAEKDQLQCPQLYNAIRKYGSENFEASTILYCSINELDDYEKKFIALYDLLNKKLGYNISEGGTIRFEGEKRKEISKKIGENTKKYWAIPEHRELRLKAMKNSSYKISEKLKEKWEDEEWANKSIESNRKRFTNELRQKMSDSKKKANLPLHIYYRKNKGEIIGYDARLKFDQKSYSKTFSKSSETMEEKLQSAKDWLKNIKEEIGYNDK